MIKKINKNKSSKTQENSIKSVMPGLITKIMVKAGDKIKAGAPLCVLEAMKMENELQAPKEGSIASVKIQVGKTVKTGEELFTIT